MDPDQTAPIGHFLLERLLKHFSRQQKQTTFVVIGILMAKLKQTTMFVVSFFIFVDSKA